MWNAIWEILMTLTNTAYLKKQANIIKMSVQWLKLSHKQVCNCEEKKHQRYYKQPCNPGN